LVFGFVRILFQLVAILYRWSEAEHLSPGPCRSCQRGYRLTHGAKANGDIRSGDKSKSVQASYFGVMVADFGPAKGRGLVAEEALPAGRVLVREQATSSVAITPCQCCLLRPFSRDGATAAKHIVASPTERLTVALTTQVQQQHQQKQKQATALRVLVADDSPLCRSVLVSALEQAGLSCAIARDGVEALAALRAERFRVVLMDLAMPGLGGIAAIQSARIELGLTTPIIGMGCGPLLTAEALAAGADAVLPKPSKPAEILKSIAAVELCKFKEAHENAGEHLETLGGLCEAPLGDGELCVLAVKAAIITLVFFRVGPSIQRRQLASAVIKALLVLPCNAVATTRTVEAQQHSQVTYYFARFF